MPKHTLLSEPDHVDEPQQVQEYWGLVSRMAATQHPVIVRRGGCGRRDPDGISGTAPGIVGAAGGRAARGPSRLGTNGASLSSSPAMV